MQTDYKNSAYEWRVRSDNVVYVPVMGGRQRSVAATVSEEMFELMQRLDVVGNDLDDHHHRQCEQHAPDAPDPAPEQQTREDGDLIHGRGTTEEQGGQERAFERGDEE